MSRPSLTIDASWYSRPVEMARERISAGGAVVRIERGRVLVALVREIGSKGHLFDGYVLPKGGIETGEDLLAGARREIAEEIGLTELVPLGPLGVLERQDANKEWWSISHYFLFLTEQIAGEIRDREHHFDPGWFSLETLPGMFWPDERRFLEENRLRIHDIVLAHQNAGER